MATTKITEKVYKAVKILLNGGASVVEAAEYMSISDSTVYLIKNAETYEEYKHKMYASSGAYRKKMEAIKKAEKEQKAKDVANEVGAVPASKLPSDKTNVVEKQTTVVVQATHYMMEELKQTNEYLKLISNKLAYIVDELCGVKPNV